MKRFLYTLLAVITSVISCREETEVPARTIFTLTLADRVGGETWLILHDNETGELLESRQVLGEPCIFESTKRIESNKLSVTILSKFPATDWHVFADVYTGIDVGSVWNNFSGDNFIDLPIVGIGAFNFTINDVPRLDGFSISDAYGEHGVGVTFQNNKVSGASEIFYDQKSQLITIDIGDKPKYLIIKDFIDGGAYDLSYNNFKDFDKYVTVSFPKQSAPRIMITEPETKGRKGDQRSSYVFYRSQFLGSQPEKDKFSLGFLNDFADYQINFDVGSFHYFYEGPAPSTIDYADATGFNVSGSTIEDYSFNATKEFKYSNTTYRAFDSSTKTRYSIYFHDPVGVSKHHNPFTDELITKYAIPMDKLLREETRVIIDGTFTHDQFLKSVFDPNFTTELKKEVSVSIY